MHEDDEDDENDTDDDGRFQTVLQGDPQVQNMMKDLRAATEKNANKKQQLVPLPTQKWKPGGNAEASEYNGDATALAGVGTQAVAPFSLQALWYGPHVLHPDGRFRSFWNVLMALLIFWCAVVVPLEIGYDSALRLALGDGFGAWEGVNYAIDFLFMLDIALNFRTGFIVDGQFVTSHRRIANEYIRGNFVIDLIGSFPINLILDLAMADDGGADASSRLNRPLRMLRIVKLNRLLRLSKLSKYLKYLEVILEFNPSFMRVLNLVLLMVGCCHWMGCTWWLVTEIELQVHSHELNSSSPTVLVEPNGWHPSQELLDSPLSAQFASGFFWGAGMVTAMVPYDIMPASEPEYYVTAVCMFVGLLLNAFVIGSMASAMANIDSKKQICRGKLETIGLYLLVNNVHADLRTRILEYYEYLYTSSQSMQDLNLLGDLPPSLSTRLAITVHRRIVVRAPLFNSLSDLALLNVLTRLRPLIYVPGQVIAMSGSKLTHINFIKKGRVYLIKDLGSDNEQVQRVLGANDNFGLEDAAARRLMAQLDSPPEAPMGPGTLTRSRASRFSVALHQAGTHDWYRNFFTTQMARESARAATYCDVVSLDVHDLSAILAKDYKARCAERERRGRASQQCKSTIGAASSLGKARVNFMQRLHGARRKDVNTDAGAAMGSVLAVAGSAGKLLAVSRRAKVDNGSSGASAQRVVAPPAASKVAPPSASDVAPPAASDVAPPAASDNANKLAVEDVHSGNTSAPRASCVKGGSRESMFMA